VQLDTILTQWLFDWRLSTLIPKVQATVRFAEERVAQGWRTSDLRYQRKKQQR
jgi:hypothetical protein